MAYITPSGRPPNSRISTVSRPISAPLTKAPSGVTGEATMSLAMNQAPSIRPPENHTNSGEG